MMLAPEHQKSARSAAAWSIAVAISLGLYILATVLLAPRAGASAFASELLLLFAMGWQALALSVVSTALSGVMTHARLEAAICGLRSYARIGVFLIPVASVVALLSHANGILPDSDEKTVIDFSDFPGAQEQ